MTDKEREKCRKVQDAIISHPKTRKYVEEMGADYPLFGDGTPSYMNLQLCLYPGLIDIMERFVLTIL